MYTVEDLLEETYGPIGTPKRDEVKDKFTVELDRLSKDSMIAYMEESKDVRDWNLRRSRLIKLIGRANKELIARVVDGSGLIVRVLGRGNKEVVND